MLTAQQQLRPEQEAVLQRFGVERSSTLHVDRTGAGKSLAYSLLQLLGLVDGKLVIVVPL